MKNTTQKTTLLLILMLLLFVLLPSTSSDDATNPIIDFVDPTPDDGASQSIGIVGINVNITEENLSSLTYNWDGTNTTIYDDSLVLMYNFDNIVSLGEDNSVVVDLSGNGINGTAYGDAAPVTGGKYFGAYTFDGAGDYVLATQTGLATGANPRTIMAWINATDTESVKVPFAYGDTNANVGEVFGFYLSSDETLNFWGMAGSDFSTATKLTTNVWHHVAVTYDGSDVRVYLDAEQVGPTTARTLNTGNQNLFIGSDGDIDPNDYPYSGLMDEVRIWNRCLTDEEIYIHYASNLNKINQSHWNYNITQSKNTTEELDIDTYSYQVFAEDISNNQASTEQRTIHITGPTPPVPEASALLLLSIGIIGLLSVIYIKKKTRRNVK